MKRLVIVFLILSMVTVFSSCEYRTDYDDEEEIELDEWAQKDLENSRRSPYAVDFNLPVFETTNGVKYVSNDEREKWREPLRATLAKLDIADGAALVDLNFDGIAEIAIWDKNGGAEGNGVFEIFDIYAAEKVGEISTGWWWSQPIFENEEDNLIGPTLDDNKIFYGQWRTYIDDEGNCKIFGQFNHDSDDQVEHYFSEMKWDTEKNFCFSEVAYKYLHEFRKELRCYDGVMFVIDVDHGFYFYEGDNQVRDLDEEKALEYFDDMLTRYKIVEGTQMKVFKWEDIQGYRNMRQEQLIENMVDWLLSSEQQFIMAQTVDMN